MAELRVTPAILYDKTNNWLNVHGGYTRNRERLFNFLIEPNEHAFSLSIITGGSAPFNPFHVPLPDYLKRSVPLPLNEMSLQGTVHLVREAWRTEVLNFPVNGTAVYQREWNLSQVVSPDVQQSRLLRMALAGEQLYNALFFPSPSMVDNTTDLKALNDIGEVLRDSTAQASMWFRVTSGTFYLPWNLIYSRKIMDRKGGSDVDPTGFWGYQHLIEHIPAGNEYRLDTTEPLQMRLYADEGIEADLLKLGLDSTCHRSLGEHLKTYAAGSLYIEEYTQCLELSDALMSIPLQDQLIYFFCHAISEGDAGSIRFEPSYLKLGDEDCRITVARLKEWIGNNRFEHHPVVFLNACQSSQATSIFFQSLANFFLDHGASAVIGTQTDIPAVFACQFARRFWEEFLRGGESPADSEPRSIGKILFDLRREFLDKYRNPLGFLYSVYRGADVHLSKELQRNRHGETG